jgi:D-2-hydroxyacid dehydrogenase (NADP+)
MTTVVVRHDLDLAPAVADRLDDVDLIVADDTAETIAALERADVLAINPGNWDGALLDGLSEGDWIQSTAIGYDAFPIEVFAERGVQFTNASGNYGPVVTEHVFAMAFAFSRGLGRFSRMQRDDEWDRSLGLELGDWLDATMTVIGLGNLGEVIAERGQAFGFAVNGVKRNPAQYDGCVPPDRVLGNDEWTSRLPETDLLVATVPLTEETEGMVDEAVFAALPDSAMLVNVARGPVVDQDALLSALEAGEVAGAGLDVFEEEPLPSDSPLWDREDVIITPHVAGRSDSFADRYATLFVENYERRERGDPLRNRIV